MYACMYSSRDECERWNIQGRTDIQVNFRNFRFVRFQDFSKGLGFHKGIVRDFTVVSNSSQETQQSKASKTLLLMLPRI